MRVSITINKKKQENRIFNRNSCLNLFFKNNAIKKLYRKKYHVYITYSLFLACGEPQPSGYKYTAIL